MQHDIVGRGWAFPLHVGSQRGLALVGGFDEINQAIAIILGTAVGERVMRPEFGSRLHELVFAPLSEETRSLARHFVEDALAMWEPRIEVEDIQVTVPDRAAPDYQLPPGMLSIEIQYSVKSTGDQRSLVYPFYTISAE